MQPIKDLLAENIPIEFSIEWGEIGTHYSVILIADGNRIIPIGKLLYHIWAQGLYTDPEVAEEIRKLGKEAWTYRGFLNGWGGRDTMPSLCYRGDYKSGDTKLKTQ